MNTRVGLLRLLVNESFCYEIFIRMRNRREPDRVIPAIHTRGKVSEAAGGKGDLGVNILPGMVD